jgi:replicative DNA helicase
MEVRMEIKPIEVGKLISSCIEMFSRELLDGIISTEINSIKTGYSVVDNLFGGFYKKSLTIIAGHEGIGKSTLFLNLARNVITAKMPINTLIISGNNSVERLVKRLLLIQIGFNRKGIDKAAKYVQEEICEAAKCLESCPLFIETGFLANFADYSEVLEHFILEKNIQLIIFDSLEIIRTESMNPERKSKIIEELKTIALKHNLAIVCSYKIPWEVSDGKIRLPTLEDLNPVYLLNILSDTILLLTRDAYYSKESDNLTRQLDVKVMKNNNAGIGAFELIYDKNTGLLSSYV